MLDEDVYFGSSAVVASAYILTAWSGLNALLTSLVFTSGLAKHIVLTLFIYYLVELQVPPQGKRIAEKIIWRGFYLLLWSLAILLSALIVY